MATNAAKFEIYTQHPETRDGGWDIKHVIVLGVTDWQDAKAKIKTFPLFDEIITADYCGTMNDDQANLFVNGTEFLVQAAYNDGRITERY